MRKEKIYKKDEKPETANKDPNQTKDDQKHGKIDLYKEWMKYKEANK